jgi:hypothetical protein
MCDQEVAAFAAKLSRIDLIYLGLSKTCEFFKNSRKYKRILEAISEGYKG